MWSHTYDPYDEQLYFQRQTLPTDTRYSHGNQNGTFLWQFIPRQIWDSHASVSCAPYQPHTWWRYIDDIFMIWTHSVDDLHAFTSYLNSIHLTIKFTSNYSFTSIPFLDVNVYVDNDNITTDLYTKATQHTKRAIPFSLALRLRRICSSDETFKQSSNELKSYLNNRGYNLSFLNHEVARVHTYSYSSTYSQRHFHY